MASDPFQPYDSPHAAGPMEKKGMSPGTKLLIILAIVLLLLILLCCGGLVLFGVVGGSYVGEAINTYINESMSTDPQVIRQVTDRIVSIDVSEELQPVQSMEMKVPFTDAPMMTLVTYADESQQCILVLIAFGPHLAGQNEEQMQKQMEQALRNQGMDPEANITISERYERQIEVRGRPVTFFFAKGENTDSGRERIQVAGTFEGRNGTVMLMVFADPETLSEDEIVGTIESIK